MAGDSRWTFEAMEKWIETGFARHDEVQRIAREESLRVEQRVERLADDIGRMRVEAMTREEFERRHSELQAHDEERARVLQANLDRQTEGLDGHQSKDTERLEARLAELETWKANVTGRAVGLGVLGGLLVAGVTAIITHIIGAG